MTSSEPEKPVKPKRPRKPNFSTWAKKALRPAPYDPLDLTNLGKSVELELLSQDVVRLPKVPRVVGSGVYALYYNGDHKLYRPIKGTEEPIYVGKAVPKGGRKGVVADTEGNRALFDRIEEHHETLKAAKDLDPEDFSVRFLVAVEVFVPLTERVMITQLRPVWNLVVDGFGNHDPGGNRRDQARPPWDELHPGRWWSHPYHMSKPSKYSSAESERRVADFFAGRQVEPDDESDDAAEDIEVE